MKTLALFDFDGTMTRRDSFLDFLLFAFGPAGVGTQAIPLAPTLLAYAVGILRNDVAKERVVQRFFRSFQEERLRALGAAYAARRIPRIMKQSALRRLRWHQAEGHRVVIVSATFYELLEPWAREQGVELIATAMEARDGRLTGGLATPNCYGPEKVRRLCLLLEPSAYPVIYAYGDSRGDREMLALATHPHYRAFR
jgi:HAD superfamily hydrolase (TIGR01490 family)